VNIEFDATQVRACFITAYIAYIVWSLTLYGRTSYYTVYAFSFACISRSRLPCTCMCDRPKHCYAFLRIFTHFKKLLKFTNFYAF